MLGLILLIPFFLHAQDWPTDPAQKECGFKRKWNFVCAPICHAPDWTLSRSSDLNSERQKCMDACGFSTNTTEEQELSWAIYKATLTNNCIEEMKHGWVPPPSLMFRVKSVLSKYEVN